MINTVYFDNGFDTAIVYGLHQWDRDITLEIKGVEANGNVWVQFSMDESGGTAVPVYTKVENGVISAEIPGFVFEKETTKNYVAYAFVYETNIDYGKTIKTIKLNINARPKPDDYVYTEPEKKRYDLLEERIKKIEENGVPGGGNIEIDSELSETSENPVQNKVVDKAFKDLGKRIPTKTSQLDNDEGFLTKHQDLSGYAEKATTLEGYGITDGATKEDVKKLSEEKADKSEIPSLVGYATESYVQEYAQPKGDYLTQHQDISGKQDKTDNNLKTNSKNVVGAINEVNSDLSYYENYVTPQMFGAKGNKSNDDTEAIKSAIATGKDVFFPQGIYKVTDTLNIKSGQRIFGAKSAQIRPENCEVLFHLSAGCSIEGFSVKIYGTQSVPNTIKTVFLADDASKTLYFSNISDGTSVADSLLHARISDMLIWNVASLAYTTTDYTVFDFHSTADSTSFYDILVQGCTCINLKTHGYLARVYGVNDGWVSTCVFDRNYSRGFVWHYFFADNDSNIQNSGAGMHSITNCTAQCKAETNGFVFSTEQNDFNASNNVPWDWSHSLNCRLTPYVISYDISTPFRHIKAPVSVGEMIKYDGVQFIPIGHLRADLIQAVNGNPDPRLTYRPIGIGGEKCVKLATLPDVNFSDFLVIRFSIIDRYGVNEISISKWNNKIYCSQPLTPNHIIGVTSDWKKIYLYKKLNDGSYDYINAEMVILQYPFANADVGYSSSGNNTASFNQNFTIDIADNIATCVVDEVPEGLVELPIVIKKQLYISDENGNNYSLKIVNGEIQVEEATLESIGDIS